MNTDWPKNVYWEEIEHTADWGLRVRGADLRGLFENAALGMMSLLDGKAQDGTSPESVAIDLQSPDNETLLVDWLTELLYLIEIEHVVFPSIAVDEVADLRIRATIEKQAGLEFKKHIKAVTYYELEIVQNPDGYETVLIFDV